VDLEAGREVARVRIPVTERDAAGELTHGYPSDTAVDESGGRIWVVTTEGQILTIDLGTHAVESRFADPDLSFLNAVWDSPRSRLILAGENFEEAESGFYAFSAGRLTRIAREARLGQEFAARVLAIRGSELRFLAQADVIEGEGSDDSGVGTLNLETDEVVAYRLLPEGSAQDLAIGPDGRNWVVDDGRCRLLVFSADWKQVAQRPMSGSLDREGTLYAPTLVDADATRAVVAGEGQPPKPILEYAVDGALVSDLPVREYDATRHGELGDVILLPDGRLCAAFRDPGRLVFLDAGDARPFPGFDRE
jgi:hypothetical protein